MRNQTGSESRRIAEAVDSEDPVAGLAAVRSLRVLVERLESLHVDSARALGWSWQDIAAGLGVSKQAVHKKHAGRGLRRKREG
ncbi:MAG: RNA polymerase subunit sigma-70 [Actinomycetota bacterium]|nr:RNA polymerase subunit sigma-70 [Actinomycetota bacterium]